MTISIHDRVKLIKGEAALETGDPDGYDVPPHGITHNESGSDPIPGKLLDPQNADELQGVPVADTTPAAGQALVFDGTEWAPTTETLQSVLDGGSTATLESSLAAELAESVELYNTATSGTGAGAKFQRVVKSIRGGITRISTLLVESLTGANPKSKLEIDCGVTNMKARMEIGSTQATGSIEQPYSMLEVDKYNTLKAISKVRWDAVLLASCNDLSADVFNLRNRYMTAVRDLADAANPDFNTINKTFIGAANGALQGEYLPKATVADTPQLVNHLVNTNIMNFGTASNCPQKLPDATSLPDVTSTTKAPIIVRFWNISSEVVPVTNFSGALQSMVGPGCKLECTLKTGGTAAGVWVCCLTEVDELVEKFDNDFTDIVNDIIPAGVRPIFSGAGAGVTAYGSGQKYFGTARISTGTDANGFALVKALGYQANIGTIILNAGKPVIIKARALINALSDATNTYVLRLGAHDSDTGAQPANGVYFQTDADGDIYGVCRAGGAETQTANGGGKISTYGGEMTDFTAVSDSSATRIDFWVNTTYLGVVTSTIPKTALMNINSGVTKTAGLTARNLYLDRLTVKRFR